MRHGRFFQKSSTIHADRSTQKEVGSVTDQTHTCDARRSRSISGFAKWQNSSTTDNLRRNHIKFSAIFRTRFAKFILPRILVRIFHWSGCHLLWSWLDNDARKFYSQSSTPLLACFEMAPPWKQFDNTSIEGFWKTTVGSPISWTEKSRGEKY